ncbi:MAG: hypothetical protein A2Z72_06320 [Omnitrophica bacterium RBG_13_46_9]|nr:MAG: hypothetical protein A2Z72_06320 [Omnitrophica bacterium RBG_13_46_9]
MKRSDKKLGAILVEKKIISASQLDNAISEQEFTREFIGAILIKKGYVSERDLLNALSEQFGIPFYSLKDIYIDWGLVEKFNPSTILENKCFPVKREKDSITIAILNPLDAWALKKAEDGARGLAAKFVLVSQSDMEEAIKRYKQFMRRSASDMLE